MMRSSVPHTLLVVSLSLAFVALDMAAQVQTQPQIHLHPQPVPMPAPPTMQPDPIDPPARTFADPAAQLSFQVPAGWQVTRRDGEYSTLRMDARTAPRRSKLIAVAMMDFNPFPRSTFSGALFYASLIPASTPAACALEAHGRPNVEQGERPVGDMRFSKGRDEHGKICTEGRDTVYAAMRHGACVRFDLAINTFCGGEVSGARDMTEEELENIQTRLDAVLDSVHFGK